MQEPQCLTDLEFLSCGERMLQSSQRLEKAQRGAQTLLDLFCGCQGEFLQKYLNVLSVEEDFQSVPKETLQEKTIKSFQRTFQQQYHSLLE